MNYYKKAKQVILDRGWAQGTFGRLTGPVCVHGAMIAAASPDNNADPGQVAFYVREADGTYSSRTPEAVELDVQRAALDRAGFNYTWNDSPFRTKSEVLDVLDLYAAKFDAGMAL